MAEKVTRSGRKVKNVVRYEPELVKLVDDFSDGSFGDSDFDGTMDGLSEGSHVENTDSGDESYTEKDCVPPNEESDDLAMDEMDDDTDDSVITECVPEEEILEIASSTAEESSDSSSSESDSGDSDDSDDTGSSDSDSDSSDSESNSSDCLTESSDEEEDESSEEEAPPPKRPRQAWKKPRHEKR